MCVTTLDLHLTQIFLFYNEGDLVDAVVPLMEAGDHVAIDEPIAKIETDKLVAVEGDTFEPGTKIAVISKFGEGSNDKTQERLKDSQNTFAVLTTFNEVDMTNLIKLRSDYKDVFIEKHGVKLGLMSGFVKAAVSGLQNQPIINAVIDEDDSIICRDYIDISIAIGTSKVSHLSK
ncbi:hypothetical protein ACSBR1_037029 [Camellia fascicularis]